LSGFFIFNAIDTKN